MLEGSRLRSMYTMATDTRTKPPDTTTARTTAAVDLPVVSNLSTWRRLNADVSKEAISILADFFSFRIFLPEIVDSFIHIF